MSGWIFWEDCEVKAVTDKAVLVTHDGEDRWFPKSVLEEPDKYERGDTGVTLAIKEWFAEQEEIEGD